MKIEDEFLMLASEEKRKHFSVSVLTEPEQAECAAGEARESNQLDIHSDRRSVEPAGEQDSRGGENF